MIVYYFIGFLLLKLLAIEISTELGVGVIVTILINVTSLVAFIITIKNKLEHLTIKVEVLEKKVEDLQKEFVKLDKSFGICQNDKCKK